MLCFSVKKRLSAYLDNELSEKEKKRVSSHLNSCSRCLEELELLQECTEKVKGLRKYPAPPHFLRVIEEKISQEERAKGVKRLPFPITKRSLSWGVAFALTLILFAGSFHFWKEREVRENKEMIVFLLESLDLSKAIPIEEEFTLALFSEDVGVGFIRPEDVGVGFIQPEEEGIIFEEISFPSSYDLLLE